MACLHHLMSIVVMHELDDVYGYLSRKVSLWHFKIFEIQVSYF